METAPGHTRRHFGGLALTALPALGMRSAWDDLIAPVHGQSSASPGAARNRSLIGGLQFALQPFCYHDLPMTPENRGTLIARLVQNGFGMVELHATWVEPRFNEPGVSAEQARERLRAWRLGTPTDHYARVKR